MIICNTSKAVSAEVKRQRELHIALGTNMIIPNYKGDDLKEIFSAN